MVGAECQLQQLAGSGEERADLGFCSATKPSRAGLDQVQVPTLVHPRL
eukprot:SAG11_NODE_35895_length_264_cov_0.945455_1_plen_47_part_01